MTAIWSHVFKDVKLNDLETPVTIRMSVIGYARQKTGNYTDRCSSYVATFQARIQQLMDTEWYQNVGEYENLDLAKYMAAGKFTEEQVWTNDEDCTIKCLVLPMHFNPCSFLSPFAWCIDRMRREWMLSRLETTELVYLGAIQSSCLPFVWLTEKLLGESPEYCQGEIKRLGLSRFYHEEICKRAKRTMGNGGKFPRHQVSTSHHPGMESKTVQVFTEEAEKRKNLEMGQLLKIMEDMADRGNETDGARALERLRTIERLGPLNVLKVLPLAALVGLFDIELCFPDALYGEIPQDKPHARELKDLGCDTAHLQKRFVESINERLGQPREFFFHGDHVLCMSEGLHNNPNLKKRDAFFMGMPLFRFAVDDERRVVQIMRRRFGRSTWERHAAHDWTPKSNNED